MLKNYFKTAFRNLLKQKGFSFINIFGLATGMAVVILILLWTGDEWSFDKHHEYSNRIYRVVEIQNNKGRNPTHVPFTMAPLAAALKVEFPEVQESVRIKYMGEMAFTKDQITFFEKHVMMADSTIFNIFSFNWLKGTPHGALDQPNTVVLAERVASKLFGDQDPIGKQVVLNATPVTITGVIKNPPIQSHMKMDVILSLETFKITLERYGFKAQEILENWDNNMLFTYVLLDESVKREKVESKMPAFLQKHKGPETTMQMYLQNLEDIYLKSELIGFEGPWKKGNKNHVMMFFMIALFILLIACINFMNLTTAKSAGRAREVGLRKVFGGGRHQLVFQFLSESFVVTSLGMLIAIAMVEFMLPFFNDVSGKSLALNFFSNWNLPIGLLGITVVVSILAGSYPAFYLSKFQPTRVLKGSLSSGSKNTSLRKILVVFQFSISIVLMIGTWIIFYQMDFLLNRDLGFNKEHIVVIEGITPEIYPKMEGFKTMLSSSHHVVSSTLCSNAPGEDSNGQYGMIPEGMDETENWVVPVLSIDQDYIQTFGIETVQGRPFSKEFPSDLQGGLIINETAARKFGWEDPIGKKIDIPGAELPGGPGRVVGVVKDYFFKSLHEQVEPLVMFNLPKMYNQLAVRINSTQTQESIVFLENSWKEITGNAPFKYHFLDDFIQSLYQNEVRIGKLSLIFSFLAIFIASLGLLGLASYSTEQRTKEIGVRKILGASIPQVIYILTKDFTQWVLLANLISWPVAWYFMNEWLNGFAYHIAIPLTVFLVTAIVALLIALTTISYQVILTATANPVRALKYE